MIRLLLSAVSLHGCSFVLVDEPCDTGQVSVQDETGAVPELLFSAVGTGATHTCGILDSGEVLCWGLDDEGQTDAPDGRFSALAVGHAHACALDEDGAAQCWGRNDDRQSELTGSFVEITAGGAHSCGLGAAGEITCVGSNDWGQLDVPRGVYQAVAAGAKHTCAVTEPTADGLASLVCWGAIESVGSDDERARSVISGTDWSCGAFTDTEPTVSCTGDSSLGQHDVPGVIDFSSAVAGARHGCGLDETGSVACWGADDAGQLGAPGETFLALGSGPTSLHTCGIVDDGDSDAGPVLCWGLDAENQLTP